MLPVNLDSQKIIAQSTSHGIACAAGPAVPDDGAKGYAMAGLFIKLAAAAAGSDGYYVNYGDQNAAAFKRVSLAAQGQPFLMDGPVFSGLPSSVQDVSNDTTILLPTAGPVRTITTGGATGVILTLGAAGQEIEIVNLGGDPITFAASGTSNVADGANVSIGGLRAMRFRFVGTLWYANTPA